MSQLNEYPSRELDVLLNILNNSAPKLPTERTFKLLWMKRVLFASVESKESEEELKF